MSIPPIALTQQRSSPFADAAGLAWFASCLSPAASGRAPHPKPVANNASAMTADFMPPPRSTARVSKCSAMPARHTPLPPDGKTESSTRPSRAILSTARLTPNPKNAAARAGARDTPAPARAVSGFFSTPHNRLRRTLQPLRPPHTHQQSIVPASRTSYRAANTAAQSIYTIAPRRANWAMDACNKGRSLHSAGHHADRPLNRGRPPAAN